MGNFRRQSQQTLPRPPDPLHKLPGQTSEKPSEAEARLSQNHAQRLGALKSSLAKLLDSNKVHPESEVLQFLSQCDALATQIAPANSKLQAKTDDAASALLAIDENLNTNNLSSRLTHVPTKTGNELSDLPLLLLKQPHVFISPKILGLYTNIQSKLGRPDSFPEIFELYAHKLIPEEGTTPIRFRKQNPDKAANGISVAVANTALQSAINTRQLQVAMDIVDTTFTRPAFVRAKIIRQGLLPGVALTAAPVAAYLVASQLANIQTTMDPAMATNVAFAGIIAYIGFTGVIGVVAVTTANDQMDRVTWAPGTPLRERWIREDERAAIDKIAGAWGFREAWRRGEEDGADWEALREWIGNKGMILDRVSLMEGME